MPELILTGLDEDFLHRLHLRAARHGRSVEEEHRRILESALKPGQAEFWRRAKEIRRRPVSELVRQMRDGQ